MNLTPKVKRLIIHKVSLDAIPPGATTADGAKFLIEPGRLANGMRKALEWAKEAIEAIRQAKEPNLWKDASDEEIAGEILRRIEELKNSRGKR